MDEEEVNGENRKKEAEEDKLSEDLAVAEIVNSIEKERPAAASCFFVGGENSSCTIHRVPRVLHEANAECYEPKLASIGPYHRGKQGLLPMEGEKYQHLKALARRNPEMGMNEYVREVKELEGLARKCYSEDIGLGSNEFVKMMVLDGCFLVEMFLQIWSREFREKILFRYLISHDMLLLENQLPFFILNRIYCLAMRCKGSIKDLVLDCFKYVPLMPLNDDAEAKESYHHLLDLVHHHCLPQIPPARAQIILYSAQIVSRHVPPTRDQKPIHKLCSTEIVSEPWAEDVEVGVSIRSAEELQEAGIEFKTKERRLGGSFLDIEFHENGVIEIPYFYFSDNLHSIFQNLIAYEQCDQEAPAFFIGYASFMDDIINTAKDVQILRHTGILEHGLGSDEELARLFNRMIRGVFIDFKKTHLHKERKAINKFCGTRWHIWRAKLMRNYFYSPWAILSLAAAILLLLLTITQTVFSIYPNV